MFELLEGGSCVRGVGLKWKEARVLLKREFIQRGFMSWKCDTCHKMWYATCLEKDEGLHGRFWI